MGAIKAAEEDAQPFFVASIFLTDACVSREGGASSSNLSPSPTVLAALSSRLEQQFEVFCLAEQPEGAQRYVFYGSRPRFTVSPGSKSDSSSKASCPAHLAISLATGGATEDEFLLLHFLRLQQRPQQLLESTVIRVHDEDGEFLLIEAADFLPEWIDPDNAIGRVWLSEGGLHLVAPEVEKGILQASKTDVGPILSVARVLELFEAKAVARAPGPLTEAAFARMTSFPGTQWIDTVQHTTTAYLCSNTVAQAFQHDHLLIGRAGQAFLGRDARDMRLVDKMSRFGAAPSAEQTGTRSTDPGTLVALTIPKRLYAQLLSVRFMPPKSFHEDYRTKVSNFWRLLDSLLSSHDKSADEMNGGHFSEDQLDEGRRWDLGCKLSAGLEIAYWNDRERAANRRKTPRQMSSSTQSDAPTNDFAEVQRAARNEPGYEDFISSLDRLGYFENQIRDSARWSELERRAILTWWPLQSSSENSEQETTDDHFQAEWTDRLAAEKSRQAILTLDPTDMATLNAVEQSDSWLYDVECSNSGSEIRSQAFVNDGGDSDEQEAAKRLSAFASRIEGFVRGKGDVEGAIIDDDDGASDERSDEDEDNPALEEEEADDAQAQILAREELSELTPAEREGRLRSLLPNLHEPPTQNLPKPEPSGEADLTASLRPTTAGPESELGDGLSEDALRSAFKAQSKAYRSSRRSGADSSWQDSDDIQSDDDQPGETKTERKQRRRDLAEMLDLEPSDDEDEEEEGLSPTELAKKDEQEELLEFVRFAGGELGLTQTQLEKILDDRKKGGRWVPNSDATLPEAVSRAPAKKEMKSTKDEKAFGQGFSKGFLASRRQNTQDSPAAVSTASASPAEKIRKVTFADDEEEQPTQTPLAGQPISDTAPPNSFESLMSAMDATLDAHRRSKGLPPLDRQEAYGGEVRAEDWALRRPGGASLGSVMKDQQHNQDGGQPSSPQSTKDTRSADVTQGDVAMGANEDDGNNDDDDDIVNMDTDFDVSLISPSPFTSTPSHSASFPTPASLESFIRQYPAHEKEVRRQQMRSGAHEGLMAKGGGVAWPKSQNGAAQKARIEELDDEYDVLESADHANFASASNTTTSSTPLHPRTPADADADADADAEDAEDAEDEEDMFPDIEADPTSTSEEPNAALSSLMESWRAQGGRPGPVGNLAGQMGFGARVPR